MLNVNFKNNNFSLSGNQERNWQLLKHILARGPSAYDKFREALILEGEPENLIELLPEFDDRFEDTVDEVEPVDQPEFGEQVFFFSKFTF